MLVDKSILTNEEVVSPEFKHFARKADERQRMEREEEGYSPKTHDRWRLDNMDHPSLNKES